MFRQNGVKAIAFCIALIGAVLLTVPSCIKPAYASEPTLIDALAHMGFTNIALSDVETFPAGEYTITLYAEFAAYCNDNELSYYQISTTTYNIIFTGPEGGSGYLSPSLTKKFTIEYEFGLSMLSPGPHRYFTQNGQNPDGEVHSRVYRNLDKSGMYLIGFENLYGAGDRDYQDLVFSIERTLGGETVGGNELPTLSSSTIAQLLGYISMVATLGFSTGLIRRRKTRVYY